MKNNLKILVATDYSKTAESAERYAVQLAKTTGSELSFLHVFRGDESFPRELVDLERMDTSPVEFEVRKLEQHVEEVFNSMKIGPDEIKYNCRIGKGNITAEILNISAEESADFIVLGTHGTGAVKKAFFGTHAWDAIKKAGIPVLAIPQEATFSKVQEIVFGTEYRPGEMPVIKYLIDFAKLFGAELTVLHIANNVFSPEFEREMFERFRKEVKSKVNYDKLNIRLINGDDLVDGLNGFCVRNKACWLVMSHEKASILVSLFNPVSFTKKMSFHTHVPLFAIPDGYKVKTPHLVKHGDIEAGDFFADQNH